MFVNNQMPGMQPMMSDHGPNPYIVDIDTATIYNTNYRTVLWTGKYLQLALMSIPAGGEIGLEVHPETDQFIRIESGLGMAKMGDSKDNLTYQQPVSDGYAVLVPAGTWHNIVNTGSRPLKVYTLYAPPHHPHGTIQKTKAQADAEEMAPATMNTTNTPNSQNTPNTMNTMNTPNSPNSSGGMYSMNNWNNPNQPY